MVLEQPLDHIYLASTAAMDFFSSLDAMDSLRLSGAKEDGWYIEAAKEAMRDGSLIFAGKYNQPDYELLLSEQCRLAIENTMILHNPEVKEKLEQIGIPVIVERSSYEPEPLGRMEWVKFYGALLGKEDQAEALFNKKGRGSERRAKSGTDTESKFGGQSEPRQQPEPERRYRLWSGRGSRRSKNGQQRYFSISTRKAMSTSANPVITSAK